MCVCVCVCVCVGGGGVQELSFKSLEFFKKFINKNVFLYHKQEFKLGNFN